jgi:hypothetical protein
MIMPALPNPRWERFALALYAGLAGATRLDRAQSTAYRIAYPNCSEGNSAEAAASRLLRRVKPISDRVRELQQEAAARLQPKLDVSRERIGRRLDKASHIAEAQNNASAMVSSELGLAKVFGHVVEKHEDLTKPDFSKATSLHDVGTKLLQSVGYASPSDADVALALEAQGELVATLEAIAERAQSLSAEQ